MSKKTESLKPFSSEWYRARAEEMRHNGKTVTQHNHFLGMAEAMAHAERFERERDQARKLAEDESKWAKQYFEERNDARATAKFWQEQYGHANPEHDWEEFDWEKW